MLAASPAHANALIYGFPHAPVHTRPCTHARTRTCTRVPAGTCFDTFLGDKIGTYACHDAEYVGGTQGFVWLPEKDGG